MFVFLGVMGILTFPSQRVQTEAVSSIHTDATDVSRSVISDLEITPSVWGG